MMITTAGIIIQIRMEDVSILGRITSGVKLINLDDKVSVAQIAKVREKVTDENGEIAVEDMTSEVAEEEPKDIDMIPIQDEEESGEGSEE